MPAFPVGSYRDVSLPQLPGAEREARTIAALLHTRPLIGEEALEDVVTMKMQEAQVIHLATHGLLVQASVLTTSSLSASMSVDLPPGAIALAQNLQMPAVEVTLYDTVKLSLPFNGFLASDTHTEPASRFGHPQRM
jgi:CHAT domain-containing protein